MCHGREIWWLSSGCQCRFAGCLLVDRQQQALSWEVLDAEVRTIMQEQDNAVAQITAVAGIDAAVTARHHIAVREVYADGTEQLSRFTVDPTLAGLASLSRRLAALPIPVDAVVEPTSMAWLVLTPAAERGGGQMSMVGSRHSARLRGAIMGKNKWRPDRFRGPHPRARNL